MCQLEVPEARLGLNSPDPLVREAFLMAHDYIDYVTKGGADGTMGPAPTACTAALRHAGDELLTRFPIFFRRWPRVFQDVTENTACPMLMSILDEHFFPPVPGGRRRDLAWSAVLSVYVLAGQMALHCQERGMLAVLPQLKECVGAYVDRVICPEIRDRGGWTGFVSRFGEKQDLEGQLKKACWWTLLALAISIITYFFIKRMA
ncbi:BCL2 like 16 [Amphiprion ocellaris]|uniref:Bcl-2 Bcl-2 homology region 1-3 domain-containing protein n=1 Tax=Amphiprion ocellaris TaxID=80972 RepID=A0AAQ5XIV9_AMPOC|nr:BCL2 like 16 [Amphiprion ocellaris]XP_023122893.1 BCL2 like 16 [Amphiprion ocellaris]